MPLYDHLSPFYDLLTISERTYRRQAVGMLNLRPGETLLEIGCGTGQTLIEAAEQIGEDGLLVGLDLSAGMLAQAQSNLQEKSGTAVSLLRGSGLRLPLAADSCNAVFLSFTLELLGLYEQHRLLSEVRRVLYENGRLALVMLSTHLETPASGIYWSLHEMFPAIVDCRPIDAAPLLAAAGFSVTRQEYNAMFGLPLATLLAVPQQN